MSSASAKKRAIHSVCAVLVAVLGVWGVEMDPVMMLNIIVAVGFSVDYTAHISYHYYKAIPAVVHVDGPVSFVRTTIINTSVDYLRNAAHTC